MSSSNLHDLLASRQNPLLRPTTGSSIGRLGPSGVLGETTLDNAANDSKSTVSNFQALIKKWEDQRSTANWDATDLLNEMADILERVS